MLALYMFVLVGGGKTAQNISYISTFEKKKKREKSTSRLYRQALPKRVNGMVLIVVGTEKLDAG